MEVWDVDIIVIPVTFDNPDELFEMEINLVSDASKVIFAPSAG